MKVLFDMFPVILFFIAYFATEDRAQGIYVATAAAIAGSILQVVVSWLLYRRVSRMYLVTLAMLVVLGGATLLLHDKRFIMWKPTAVHWLFAAAFLGSQFIGGKNLAQRMMEHSVSVPDPIWVRLNLAWVLFFAALGAANLYVAFNFTEQTWVTFKLFGMLGLTFLFAIGQFLYLMRHAKVEEKAGGGS